MMKYCKRQEIISANERNKVITYLVDVIVLLSFLSRETERENFFDDYFTKKKIPFFFCFMNLSFMQCRSLQRFFFDENFINSIF